MMRGVSHSVLIVDDHPSFRSTAGRLLESEGFTVAGTAGTAAEALSTARELQPDVVLLDLNLPDGNGYVVAEALASEVRGATVVLVSTHDPEDFRPSEVSDNVAGFVPKQDLSGATLASLLV